jgi:hypothetical protein
VNGSDGLDFFGVDGAGFIALPGVSGPVIG